MSTSTKISTICAIGVLLLLGAIIYQVASLLWYFGLFALLLSSLFGLYWLALSGLLANERFLERRAERQTAEAIRDKAALDASIIVSGGDAWVREEIEGRVEYARLGGTRLRVNSHDHIPTESERLYASTLQTTGQTKMLGAGQIIPQLAAPIDLLSHLDKAERVLIKGASDAGKTTLLQHVASRSNGVLIIDPHFAPGIWPVSDSRVIGAGRNYATIDQFLAKLMDQVNDRYQRRAKGELNFDQITVIIDELQSIRAECQDAGKILSMLIRESRKVGFRLFIGSHSELVKPLGLEGQGDVREGLLIVRLEIDQITKQRRVTMDAGHGEQECYIPPFGIRSVTPDLVLPPNEAIKPPGVDGQVISLMQQGLNYKEVSEAVWGIGKFGKFYNDKIDKIMAHYGIRSS